MSYNVDRWKTKELVDLVIPVESLFKHARSDWHPSVKQNDDGTTRYSVFPDGSYVEGNVEIVDGVEFLKVTDIHASGEGSGSSLYFIIEPALKDSKGRLVATRVWEGGDYIDRIIVTDGFVECEKIEI